VLNMSAEKSANAILVNFMVGGHLSSDLRVSVNQTTSAAHPRNVTVIT